MCDGRHQVNVTGGGDAIDGEAVNQLAARSAATVGGSKAASVGGWHRGRLKIRVKYGDHI
jgi:hypothetical protein